MSFGRRSFLQRTASVVGTIGAAGSAASWPAEASARSDAGLAKKLYTGYYSDLQKVTERVEEMWKRYAEWPFTDPPEEIRWNTRTTGPEWDAWNAKRMEEMAERSKTMNVLAEMPVIAPISSCVFADVLAILEQGEAQPIVIAMPPRDFADVRKIHDDPEIEIVYDGPIRARVWTVPIVTSVKIDPGIVIAAGNKDGINLSLSMMHICR